MVSINRTKTYTDLITIDDIKQHLRIDVSDDSYNSELNNLLQVALTDVEHHVQFDVVPTQATLIDTCGFGNLYRIMEPNIVLLSGITATTYNPDNTIQSQTVIATGDCRLMKGSQFTTILFPASVSSSSEIIIKYSSGSPILKSNIRHATLLRIAYYFDIDRAGASTQTINNSNAFQSLLQNEINLL